MGESDKYESLYEVKACKKCKKRNFKLKDGYLGYSELPSITVHCESCGEKGPMYLPRPGEPDIISMNKAITLWNNKKELL